MSQSLLDIKTFAQTIKSKHPEYASVDDDELTTRIIDKYPEYEDHLDLNEATALRQRNADRAAAKVSETLSAYDQERRAQGLGPARAASRMGTTAPPATKGPVVHSRVGVNAPTSPRPMTRPPQAGSPVTAVHGSAAANTTADQPPPPTEADITPEMRTPEYWQQKIVEMKGQQADAAYTASLKEASARREAEAKGKPLQDPLDVIRQQANQRAARKPIDHPASAGVTGNDLAHHLGADPAEFKNWKPSVQRRVLKVVSEAVAEDKRKREAGQTDFTPNLSYQNQMRKRTGLEPISHETNLSAQKTLGVDETRGMDWKNLRRNSVIDEELANSKPGSAPLAKRLKDRGIDPALVIKQTEPEQKFSEGEKYAALEKLGLPHSQIKALGIKADRGPTLSEMGVGNDPLTTQPAFTAALFDTTRSLGRYPLRGVEKGSAKLAEFYAGIANLMSKADPGTYWKDVHDGWLQWEGNKLSDIAREEQSQRLQALADGQPSHPDTFDQTLESLGAAGPTILKYAAIAAITKGAGMPLSQPALFGLVSAVENGDKSAKQQVTELAKNVGMGYALKFTGGLGRVPAAATFAGISGAEAALTGQPVVPAIASGAVIGGALADTEGVKGREIAEKTLQVALKSSITPEPARNAIADILKYEKGVVHSEDGRALSVYKDPKTGQWFGNEVTREQAEAYDLPKDGKPAERLSKPVTSDEYDTIISILNIDTKGKPTTKALPGEVTSVEPEPIKNVTPPKETISDAGTKPIQSEGRSPDTAHNSVGEGAGKEPGGSGADSLRPPAKPEEGSDKTIRDQTPEEEVAPPAGQPARVTFTQRGKDLEGEVVREYTSPQGVETVDVQIEGRDKPITIRKSLTRVSGSAPAEVPEVPTGLPTSKLPEEGATTLGVSTSSIPQKLGEGGKDLSSQPSGLERQSVESASNLAAQSKRIAQQAVNRAVALELEADKPLSSSKYAVPDPKRAGKLRLDFNAIDVERKAIADLHAEADRIQKLADQSSTPSVPKGATTPTVENALAPETKSSESTLKGAPPKNAETAVEAKTALEPELTRRGLKVNRPPVEQLEPPPAAPLARIVQTSQEYVSSELKNLQPDSDPFIATRRAKTEHQYAVKKAAKKNRYQEMVASGEMSAERAVEVLKSLGQNVPHYVKQELAFLQGEAFKVSKKNLGYRVGVPRSNPTMNSAADEARALGGVQEVADGENNAGEIQSLKESGKRGIVTKDGMSAGQMAQTLGEQGYFMPGVEQTKEGFDITNEKEFLGSLADDAAGSTKYYSTQYNPKVEDHPDTQAFDALTSDERGKELLDMVESGHARAADIAELARHADRVGLSDEALNDFLESVSSESKEALSQEGGSTDGYTLDENGTLLDPDGTPLFSKIADQESFGFADTEGLLAEGGPQPLTESKPNPEKQKQIERLQREHGEYQAERNRERFGDDVTRRLTALAETGDKAGRIAKSLLADRRMATGSNEARGYVDSLLKALETVRAAKTDGVTLEEYLNQGSLFGEKLSDAEMQLARAVESGKLAAEVEALPLKSARSDSSTQLDALKKVDDDVDLIRNLKSSREEDIVWVNPEGQELLRRMESENSAGFFGMQLDRKTVLPILSDLETGSQSLRNAGISSAPLDALHKQISDAVTAGKGHAMIVMEGETSQTAIKHESFHIGSAKGSAQQTGGGSAALHRALLDQSPLEDRHSDENTNRLDSMAAVGKWRKFFRRTPEYANASKALAVEETAAMVAAGDFARAGITEDEAAQYLLEWAKSFYAKNGAKAFDSFRRQEEHVTKAIEEAKRAGRQAEAQSALASGKTVRRSKKPTTESSGAEVSGVRKAKGLGERIGLRGEGEVREASLPDTIATAGLDSDSLYYQGFSDAQGRADAATLLERHGVEGSLKLLKDTPNPGKEHAVLSFMVQRILLDQAATAGAQGDTETAQRLRSEQQELAAAHATHATHSGQFNQAAASAGISVETALTVAQRIVQNEFGVNERLAPKVAAQIEEHARAAEAAYGDVVGVTAEIGDLRRRVSDLEKELSGKTKPTATRNARRSVKQQLEAEEPGLINLVIKAFALPPDAAMKMATPSDLSPETREALSKLGALELMRNPDGTIEEWNDALLDKVGDGVEPYLTEVYADAFALRRQMVKEARDAAAVNRVLKENPDATAEDIEQAISARELAKARARIVHAQQTAAAGAERPDIRFPAVADAIGELASSDQVAETAGKILLNKPTAYSDLLDSGMAEGAAKDVLREAQKVVADAKKQVEHDRLARRVEAETGKKALESEIERLETERLLARKRGSEARASLARDLQNITKGNLAKGVDLIVDISNSSRSILAAGDLSAVLRQGGFLAMAYPEQQAEPIKLMFQAITELGEMKAKALLENDSIFGLAVRAGTDFAELGREDGSLVKGEEMFRGDLAKKIPGIGAIVRASDRTYAMFLDAQRLTTFRQFATELQAMGYTFRDNPKAFRDVARLINIATGRGHLLGFNSNKLAALIMNLPFFSPRNTISRFQLLNLTLNPIAYARLSPGARYIVARSSLRFYGMMAALLGLAALAGLAVGLDWDDADFLKIKVGKTRFDLPGGVGLSARLILRLADIAVRGGRYPGERKERTVEELKKFTRGKLAPGPALGWDWYTGENYQGKTFRWVSTPRDDKSTPENIRRLLFEGAIAERVWFLPVQDVQQAWHEDGFGAALMTFPATELGVGVTTYADNPLAPKTRAERLAAQLARRGYTEEPETEEKGETRDTLTALRARAMKGEDVQPELKQMVDAGKISLKQAQGVTSASGLSKLQFWTKKLSIDKATLVAEEGGTEETRSLVPLLEDKIKRAKPGTITESLVRRLGKIDDSLRVAAEDRLAGEEKRVRKAQRRWEKKKPETPFGITRPQR